METIYTIDQIMETYKEIGVVAVGGNIIFPSHISNRTLPENIESQCDEAIDVANAAGYFARKIGLIYPNSWHDGKDLEFMTLQKDGIGECFIRFKTLQRFIEIMEIFKQNKQLPPYYLLSYFQNSGLVISFEALEKEDVTKYKYKCLDEKLLKAKKEQK